MSEFKAVRIATWNVAYGLGPILNERRRAQMEKVEADIWILTETNDVLVPPGCGGHVVHADPRPNSSANVRHGSRWVSIWSRYPLSRARVQVADPIRSVVARVDLGDERLVIFGTVLPWYTDDESDGMAVELPRQASQWSEIASAEGAPLVVAGDFNVNLGGPHYYGSRASKEGVAAALAGADLVPLTDFVHTKQRQPDYGLIDHVAAPSRLATQARVADIWSTHNDTGQRMSDHRGVVVEVRLPQ